MHQLSCRPPAHGPCRSLATSAASPAPHLRLSDGQPPIIRRAVDALGRQSLLPAGAKKKGTQDFNPQQSANLMTHRLALARAVGTARRTPAIGQPRKPKSCGQLPTLCWRNGAYGVLAAGFVLCLALAGALPVAAQELDWAKRVGGVQGNDVETDGAGNSYMAGLFEATTTFGAGEANETTLTSAGDFDILVARHDQTARWSGPSVRAGPAWIGPTRWRSTAPATATSPGVSRARRPSTPPL